MVSKCHCGTSKTMHLPLFWKSHCATCSPVYVILYHVTGSCKGPTSQKELQSHDCIILLRKHRWPIFPLLCKDEMMVSVLESLNMATAIYYRSSTVVAQNSVFVSLHLAPTVSSLNWRHLVWTIRHTIYSFQKYHNKFIINILILRRHVSDETSSILSLQESNTLC